jgi:hypothetical protein
MIRPGDAALQQAEETLNRVRVDVVAHVLRVDL